MKITISGTSFDAEASARVTIVYLQNLPAVRRAQHQQVYSWDCATQTGRRLVPMSATNGVTLPNLIVFDERDNRFDHSPVASARMQRRFLRQTDATRLADAVTSLNRQVLLPRKRVPFDAFDWLNPVASYVIWMEIEFAIFILTHPGKGLRVTVLLPDWVEFRAEITDYCDLDGFERLLENGKDPEEVERFLVPARNGRAREFRRAAIRAEIRYQESWLEEMLFPLSPEGREEVLRKIRELEERLGQFSDD